MGVMQITPCLKISSWLQVSFLIICTFLNWFRLLWELLGRIIFFFRKSLANAKNCDELAESFDHLAQN